MPLYAITMLAAGIGIPVLAAMNAALGRSLGAPMLAGVVLIAVFADKVDLDQDCVLNGELPMIPLEPPVRWGGWVHGLIIVELHEFSYKLIIHVCR